jgi:hypothetical protein
MSELRENGMRHLATLNFPPAGRLREISTGVTRALGVPLALRHRQVMRLMMRPTHDQADKAKTANMSSARCTHRHEASRSRDD